MIENEYIARSKEQEVSQAEEAEKATKKKEKKKASKVVKPMSGISKTLAQIINGEFLTKEFVLKNLGFIFFILVLLLLAVGKGYYGKQLTKDVEATQRELDELMADYVEAKAKLEEETAREKLVNELNKDGLKETVNPTKVIRIKGQNEQ